MSPTVQRHESTFSVRSDLKVKAKADLKTSVNERKCVNNVNVKGVYQSSPTEKENAHLSRMKRTRYDSSSTDESSDSYGIDLTAKYRLLGTLRNGREAIILIDSGASETIVCQQFVDNNLTDCKSKTILDPPSD